VKFKVTLSDKVLLSIGSLIVLALVAVLYISHEMVLSSFARLEGQEICTNVERAQKSIEGELENLASICGDWAAWDDTRDFMLGQAPDYNASNLTADCLANLNLNFMIFLDTSGKIFHITAIDIEEGVFAKASPSLIDYILSSKLLLGIEDPAENKSGLLVLQEEAILLAAQPISNSQSEGPISGTLIMGRYLDDNLINTISERTRLNISMAYNESPAKTADFVQADAELSKDKDVVIRILNQGNIAGYTNLHDIEGNKYITLKVNMPREIYNSGHQTVHYFMAVITLVVIIIMLILLLVIQKIILRPINRLTKNFTNIGSNNNASTKLYTERSDEIGSLARSFDMVMENLKKRMSELNTSEERLIAVNKLQELLIPLMPLEQKLKFVTDAVVRILDADFARIWVIKPGDRCDAGCTHAEVTDGPHVCRFRDKCLHLTASSGRYTHLDGKVHCRVPFGRYKIGLIAAGEQAKFLTNEAATDPRVHNHDWVEELGLVSFAGYRLTHIDGKPLGVLALFSNHPITREEDALLEGIAHSTSMVLHASQAESTIRESSEIYHALFEQANDAIFLMENEYFVDCNKRTLEMFGVTREQIINQVPIRFSPEFQADGRRSAEKAMEKIHAAYAGEPQFFEWTHTRLDDTPFDTEVSLGLIKIGGRPLLQAIVRNITDRKKAEEMLKKLNEDLELTIKRLNRSNKELQEFAYVAAHDLKSPLRGIGILTDWLSIDYGDKFDEQGKEKIKLLAGRAKRIDKLIDSIMKYSEIEYVWQDKQVVDLNQAVSEAIREINPPDNIEITIENKWPTIICNKKLIKQVFLNLLSNAVKYMDKPKGQIRVNCKEDDDFWTFSVSDNGPGIEQKYFEKIFRIFQMLSTRDENEAVGMGLPLAKKIVELYGGRIWILSEPGQGSTFFFTLPKQEMKVEQPPVMTQSITK
jgi:PAS domain S-box-containing protein